MAEEVREKVPEYWAIRGPADVALIGRRRGSSPFSASPIKFRSGTTGHRFPVDTSATLFWATYNVGLKAPPGSETAAWAYIHTTPYIPPAPDAYAYAYINVP